MFQAGFLNYYICVSLVDENVYFRIPTNSSAQIDVIVSSVRFVCIIVAQVEIVLN